jgi:hypothetical protein
MPKLNLGAFAASREPHGLRDHRGWTTTRGKSGFLGKTIASTGGINIPSSVIAHPP